MTTDEKSLNELFAALRSSSASSAKSPPTQQGSRPAARQSPPKQPPSDPAADRTASLLSLLKFNQSAQQQQSNLHGRGVSASDLVASYMGKPTTAPRDHAPPPGSSDAATAASIANPQDYLLQLLNRAQFANGAAPAQKLVPEGRAGLSEPRQPSPDPPRKDSPVRVFGSSESREPTPFDPQDIPQTDPKKDAENKPLFTYVNPFEQLAASSPRNTGTPTGRAIPLRDSTPLAREHSDFHRQEKAPHTSGLTRPAPPDRAASNEDVAPSIETPSAENANDFGIAVESLNALGAPTTDVATVAQALDQVGEQVSWQADRAIMEAEKKNKRLKRQEKEDAAVEQSLQNAAKTVKKELDTGPGNPLSELYPEPVAREVKQVIDEAAEGNIDGHASADDEKSSANPEEDFLVPVYNFVMRPFVSIDLLQSSLPQINFREDSITDIARLKKEFDQIDRTLATASSEYIVYSLPKSGGIRVIRQDDGADRHVFKETRDHVFNVAVSTAPRGKGSDLQTSIATATSGTVYWTALCHHEDNIESDRLEEHCLTFPPAITAQEEHTSGGQLKTRAKRSSRHPEFFAIGRGKSIQIVFPLHAARSEYTNKKRLVDTNNYFKQRSLKINTGKAGKDFAFSEDDTVIASLDKAGRLRFWDIRELVQDDNGTAPTVEPVEIRTPIITYSTAMPMEKSWPTSVLFVDKLRAYAKGTALRYVIVGMKQNHTLQLCDLGICKAIQEVHFPHSKESDAICSVCYHPASGIIIVGHPTRNSIYFIHLSAPKYSLPVMTQARYMTRLADKDSSLPKLEATAIMSGMREYSFASKGQLRSLDLLSISNEGPVNKEQPALFELYVMHSKGVTMLSVDRHDLGWSEDMKVMNPINAEEAGIIRIRELQQPPVAIASESSSVNGDAVPPPLAKHSAGEKSSTALTRTEKPSDRGITDDTDAGDGRDHTTDKQQAERRKKRRAGAGSADELPAAVPPPAPLAPATYASAAAKPVPNQAPTSKEPGRSSKKAQSHSSSDRRFAPDADSITLDVSSDFIDKELHKIEANVSAEFSRALKQQMDTLYKRMSDARRVIEAQHGANQEAVLRLVSKSLGENVENSLKDIVAQSIQEDVLPAIKNNTVSTVERDVLNGVSRTVNRAIQDQVKSGLAEAVTKAVQATAVQPNGKQLMTELEGLLNNTLTSRVRTITSDAMEKLSAASDARLEGLLLENETQRRADAAKIDQLTHSLSSLSSTLASMQAAQLEFKAEIARLSGALSRTVEVQARESGSPGQAKSGPQRRSENQGQPQLGVELGHIVDAMNAGNFEYATVKVRRFGSCKLGLTRGISGCNHSTKLKSSTNIS